MPTREEMTARAARVDDERALRGEAPVATFAPSLLLRPPPLYLFAPDSSPNSSALPADEPPTLALELADLPAAPATMVSTTLRGRFVPLREAIDSSAEARDALLWLTPDPRVERWLRLRVLALSAPVAWSMVVVNHAQEVAAIARDAARVTSSPQFRSAELEESTSAATLARHARIDRAVSMRAAYVAGEGALALAAVAAILVGARRLRPISAAIGAGAAAWFLYRAGAAGRCFGLGGLRDLFLALLAIFGGTSALYLCPSETSIARALRERLGLRAFDSASHAESDASRRRDLAATALCVWAGLSLPFVLDLMRRVHVRDPIRASFFVLFCLFAFFLVLVWRADFDRAAPRMKQLIVVAVIGFGITSATDIASRAGVGAVIEARTCIAPESGARMRAVAEEGSRETTSARRETQSSDLAWLIAVLAAPLAEELLYRGALQRVARRVVGARGAIATSAVVFGLAHSFSYQHAWYQHIGLGLAFATVFEMAGGGVVAVVACSITHALWNAWLAAMPVFL